jgi:hypothetical protein
MAALLQVQRGHFLHISTEITFAGSISKIKNGAFKSKMAITKYLEGANFTRCFLSGTEKIYQLFSLAERLIIP